LQTALLGIASINPSSTAVHPGVFEFWHGVNYLDLLISLENSASLVQAASITLNSS